MIIIKYVLYIYIYVEIQNYGSRMFLPNADGVSNCTPGPYPETNNLMTANTQSVEQDIVVSKSKSDLENKLFSITTVTGPIIEINANNFLII